MSIVLCRFYHHTVQIQPTPDYQYQQNFIQKQKSWDNLSAKAVGGYGYGYEYVSAPGGGGGNSNSLKGTAGHQYTNPQQMEPHSICAGYRVHPQQQQQQSQQVTHHNMVGSSGSSNNPGNRKPVYQHYGMKGASTNTDPSSYPCQHVHAQVQPQMSSTTTSTTIITSSTATHNKTMDNSNGLMMTKCMKGEHCSASGCTAAGGGVGNLGNVSGCSSNVAKK